MRSLILLLCISCSMGKSTISKQEMQSEDQRLSDYAQQFSALTATLTKKTIRCKNYSLKHLQNTLSDVDISPQNPYGVQFKNMAKVASYLNAYRPEFFDWHQKTKVKNLYLDFPFDDKLGQYHYQKASQIRECLNDFSNINFLKATLQILANPKTATKIKAVAIDVFKRYFDYIAQDEVSLLTVLSSSYFVQELVKIKITSFKDKDQFMAKAHDIEIGYTRAGKNILQAFREKDYKTVYDHEKKLREHKKEFKQDILNSFKL